MPATAVARGVPGRWERRPASPWARSGDWASLGVPDAEKEVDSWTNARLRRVRWQRPSATLADASCFSVTGTHVPAHRPRERGCRSRHRDRWSAPGDSRLWTPSAPGPFRSRPDRSSGLQRGPRPVPGAAPRGEGSCPRCRASGSAPAHVTARTAGRRGAVAASRCAWRGRRRRGAGGTGTPTRPDEAPAARGFLPRFRRPSAAVYSPPCPRRPTARPRPTSTSIR